MMSHKGIIRLECSLTLRYEVDSWPTFRSFYPTFYSYELMHRSWLKVCQRGRPLRGRRKWHTATGGGYVLHKLPVPRQLMCSVKIAGKFYCNTTLN